MENSYHRQRERKRDKKDSEDRLGRQKRKNYRESETRRDICFHRCNDSDVCFSVWLQLPGLEMSNSIKIVKRTDSQFVSALVVLIGKRGLFQEWTIEIIRLRAPGKFRQHQGMRTVWLIKQLNQKYRDYKNWRKIMYAYVRVHASVRVCWQCVFVWVEMNTEPAKHWSHVLADLSFHRAMVEALLKIFAMAVCCCLWMPVYSLYSL